MATTSGPIVIWVVEPTQDDPLAPATGCFWGPTLGTLLWLLFAIAVVLAGCSRVPQTIVWVHNEAEPVTALHGSPPGPQHQPYPTVYPSRWDDPTQAIVRNRSLLAVDVQIDEKGWFRLAPAQFTTNLNMGLGGHKITAMIYRPTAKLGHITLTYEGRIDITATGCSQIVDIRPTGISVYSECFQPDGY